MGFPYESLIDNHQQVVSAHLLMSQQGGATGNYGFDVYWASAANWAGIGGSGRAIGGAQLNPSADVDLTAFYSSLVNGGTRGAALGLIGDEVAGLYTLKQWSGYLSITYNTPPPPPG